MTNFSEEELGSSKIRVDFAENRPLPCVAGEPWKSYHKNQTPNVGQMQLPAIQTGSTSVAFNIFGSVWYSNIFDETKKEGTRGII